MYIDISVIIPAYNTPHDKFEKVFHKEQKTVGEAVHL